MCRAAPGRSGSRWTRAQARWPCRRGRCPPSRSRARRTWSRCAARQQAPCGHDQPCEAAGHQAGGPLDWDVRRGMHRAALQQLRVDAVKPHLCALRVSRAPLCAFQNQVPPWRAPQHERSWLWPLLVRRCVAACACHDESRQHSRTVAVPERGRAGQLLQAVSMAACAHNAGLAQLLPVRRYQRGVLEHCGRHARLGGRGSGCARG